MKELKIPGFRNLINYIVTLKYLLTFPSPNNSNFHRRIPYHNTLVFIDLQVRRPPLLTADNRTPAGNLRPSLLIAAKLQPLRAECRVVVLSIELDFWVQIKGGDCCLKSFLIIYHHSSINLILFNGLIRILRFFC